MRVLKNKSDIVIEDLTQEMYQYYKDNRELEHQIGRLLNMNGVIEKIKDNNIQGDFVEFGVHQGFSLMWLARLRDLHGLNDRRIIGIDSFEGLPENGHKWSKGKFSDTSIEMATKTLDINLTGCQKRGITIIKSWFNEVIFPESLNSLALIHMDCDLKTSLESALALIEPYWNGVQYILLDDWGVTEKEIPKGIREWELSHSHIKLEVINKTRLSRYYKSYTGM